MVKHKSRLEREKEVAQQERKAEEAAQALRAKRKVVHTPGSWTKQVTLRTQLLACCMRPITLGPPQHKAVHPPGSSWG